MNNTISIEVLVGSILELTFYKKFEFEIVNIKTGRMPGNEEFSVSVNDLRSRVSKSEHIFVFICYNHHRAVNKKRE